MSIETLIRSSAPHLLASIGAHTLDLAEVGINTDVEREVDISIRTWMAGYVTGLAEGILLQENYSELAQRLLDDFPQETKAALTGGEAVKDLAELAIQCLKHSIQYRKDNPT